ncbi:hypothetical protein C3747_64g2 [Trypanosoma cruzi]|uniref:Uncharacterized protein n=1 Tax=Trypanosoma cruzi TaxID=5693 RepID=A0A2V2WT50_TRYCR|nr:hypothetical protein C3747_64g2 [Trypanosoma cruzi]
MGSRACIYYMHIACTYTHYYHTITTTITTTHTVTEEPQKEASRCTQWHTLKRREMRNIYYIHYTHTHICIGNTPHTCVRFPPRRAEVYNNTYIHIYAILTSILYFSQKRQLRIHTHSKQAQNNTTQQNTYTRVLLLSGHLVLGLASGLEAFSREPPCDSVGALAVRQTPETRGTAWEFLSYYPILPSRYLRDPFTISHTYYIYMYLFYFFPFLQKKKTKQKW